MKPPAERQALPWQGLAYLLAVYLAWGSTYLAIRVAVGQASSFPPFTLVAIRTLLAGSLLLAWAVAAGHSVRLTRRDAGVLAALGGLMWLGGNGGVTWAEQRAESGYAALIVGSTPIWVAILEALLDRRAPTPWLLGSLLLGFAGVGVLAAPALSSGSGADPASLAALVVATLTWGAGSLLQRRRPPQTSPLVNSAYQMLIGSLASAAAAFLVREPPPTPGPLQWLALGHLVLVGSVIGFTSYVQTLRLLPLSVAMTYAYANPVIAVLLGWLLLGEALTPWTLGGMALVLAGVAGVFRGQPR